MILVGAWVTRRNSDEWLLARARYKDLEFRICLVGRWASRSASFNPGESVGAPVLAAHAVMEEEEAVGVVFLLNALKAPVVVAPEGVLPVRLEVVRLPDVGGGARHEFAQFAHRCGDGRSVVSRL